MGSPLLAEHFGPFISNTVFVINHNIGHSDVDITVYNNSTNEILQPQSITVTGVNQITIILAVSRSIRVVVQ